MSAAGTYVRARIDKVTKERATEALKAMELSVADAIRLLMMRVADERRLPFDIKVPNTKTRKAIAELEASKGKKIDGIDSFMAELREDDCSCIRNQASKRLSALGGAMQNMDDIPR
jgi:DNA-damage-inducible protein J